MLLTGEYEHTIDAKHRLAIPAEVRARWRPEEDGSAWYAVAIRPGLIRLYTERSFVDRAASQPLTLAPEEDEAELQAAFFGSTARLELDSAGRVRLPEVMLEIVGLPAEVVLVGAGDRLEVRDRAEWRSSRRARLAQLPELMRRISARKERGTQ